MIVKEITEARVLLKELGGRVGQAEWEIVTHAVQRLGRAQKLAQGVDTLVDHARAVIDQQDALAAAGGKKEGGEDEDRS